MSSWRPAPLGLAALLLLGGCAGGSTSATRPEPTPPVAANRPSPSPGALATPLNCTRKATPAVTEGPYFKAGSPARTSLFEAGMSGTRLLLTGHVLGTACAPVAGATLDFWQADASGSYDNAGFRLRGHQQSDAAGGYRLDTVIPGLYPGRTEHIHVKVSVLGQPVLTTQLFFPGVAQNAQDGIFMQELLVGLSDATQGKAGAFDFVVSG